MKLQDGDRVHTSSIGNSFTLSLDGVGQEDFASYSCRAENSLQREVTASIQVSGLPDLFANIYFCYVCRASVCTV